MMLVFYRMVSTCMGVGYIRRGAGTVAALATCLCWWWIMVGREDHVLSILITSTVILIGIWCAGKVEAAWGKDNQRVVIDEVAGMCVALLWIPVQWPYIGIAFLLFRFFDITKPLFIRKLEKLPGGWGVMLDDILAGLYANLLLQLLIATNLLSDVHFH